MSKNHSNCGNLGGWDAREFWFVRPVYLFLLTLPFHLFVVVFIIIINNSVSPFCSSCGSMAVQCSSNLERPERVLFSPGSVYYSDSYTDLPAVTSTAMPDCDALPPGTMVFLLDDAAQGSIVRKKKF